jgi:hypothetical protein
MASNEDIAAIEAEMLEAIMGPKRVRSDAGEVEARDIDEYLKARSLFTSGTAATRPRRGLRFTRLIPPGAV